MIVKEELVVDLKKNKTIKMQHRNTLGPMNLFAQVKTKKFGSFTDDLVFDKKELLQHLVSDGAVSEKLTDSFSEASSLRESQKLIDKSDDSAIVAEKGKNQLSI